MAIVLVVAPSFSLREDEPNPCNAKLAEEAMRICEQLLRDGHQIILVPQWEVGLALRRHGTIKEYASTAECVGAGAWPYHEAGQRSDDRYLDTKDVVEEALVFAKKNGATHVVAVANPFIHQPYTYWLVRKGGLRLMWRRVRWIGFDPESTQWWCRSWWKFTYQTVRLALGFKHGYADRQAKA